MRPSAPRDSPFDSRGVASPRKPRLEDQCEDGLVAVCPSGAVVLQPFPPHAARVPPHVSVHSGSVSFWGTCSTSMKSLLK